MIKLSIITINYNNLAGLKRTVASIVNQTQKDFEYIIIDGGSTDGSVAFIESQNQKLAYWVSEPDSGIYNAMNKGIKVAKGDYLLFLNSGDHLFDSEVIRKSKSHLAHHDLVCFDMQLIGEKASKIFSAPDALRFSDLYFGYLPHPATFIKKELFDIVGLYDESFKIISDWKFFILAIHRYHCSYLKVNETLSTFYLDGISSKENYLHERNQVLEDYFSASILDYEELRVHREYATTNRFKMLSEIEKSPIGRKAVSFFFRTYVFLFSNKKMKDLLK